MDNSGKLIPISARLALLALLAATALAGAVQAREGKLTIGVPLPQVHLGQGADAAEPLRQALMSRLRSANVEWVALAGATPAEIEADAKGKGCDQVLYTQLERKRSVGGLLSKLSPLASLLPGVAAGGGGGNGMSGILAQAAATSAGNAAAAAAQKQMLGAAQAGMGEAQALQTAASTNIRRGDNLAFDYRLAALAGNAVLKSETLHARADADGQDILSPLVEQLVQTVGPATQAAGGAPTVVAAANTNSPEPSKAERTGFLHGMFGARGKSSSTAAPPAAAATSAMPDCAQIANMPNAPISYEDCQKMSAAQQAYTNAASDPGAARPGDEQLTCDQIKGELRLQQYTAPDRAKVAETTAAVTKEQTMLKKHMAESNAIMAQEQAKVDAAAAADRATELATAGLVRTNAASVAAEAAQARVKAAGERQAAERRPTERKMIGGVADLGLDATQQFATNPRLAHLMQLAQSKGCQGS